MLREEPDETCSGYKASRWIDITFLEEHLNAELENINRSRSFQTLSTPLNVLFPTVATFMHMKYVQGKFPSFLRLQENVFLSLPSRDVWYTYSWTRERVIVIRWTTIPVHKTSSIHSQYLPIGSQTFPCIAALTKYNATEIHEPFFDSKECA